MSYGMRIQRHALMNGEIVVLNMPVSIMPVIEKFAREKRERDRAEAKLKAHAMRVREFKLHRMALQRQRALRNHLSIRRIK